MILKEVIARFGVDFDTRKLEEGDRKVNTLTSSLKTFGAVLIGGAVVNGIRNFTRELVEATDLIDKTSLSLGISAKELQAFQFSAELSGVQMRLLNRAMSIIQQRALDASRNVKEATKNFNDLGVEVRDGATGEIKKLPDLMLSLADGFKKIESPTKRVGVAMKLFGESGRVLVPFLSQGSEAIKDLNAQFEELGGGFDDDAIKAGAQAADEMAKFNVVMASIKSRIIKAILPAFQAFRHMLATTYGSLNRLTGEVDVAQVVTVAFGTALIPIVKVLLPTFIKMLSFLLTPAAKIIGVFVLIVLIIEDLIVAFQGGKNVISEFFQEFFGWDILPLLDAIAKAWATFTGSLAGSGRFIRSIFESLIGFMFETASVVSKVAGTIAGLFGDNEVSRAIKQFSKVSGQKAGEFEQSSQEAFNEGITRSSKRIAENLKGVEQTINNRNVTANVTVNGAGDPEAVATKVVDKMNRETATELGI